MSSVTTAAGSDPFPAGSPPQVGASELPPLPRPARNLHSRANLTFRGGGCISAAAKAASDLTPELWEARPKAGRRP